MDAFNQKQKPSAAVVAAQEFKQLLDMQSADTLFWPKRLGGNLFRSETYRRAAELLDQAVAQDLECAQSSGFEHHFVLPIVDIVANERAGVPSNQLELFARVAVVVAQRLTQIIEQGHGGSVHSSLLEIGVRFSGQVDVPFEEVEGKQDVVHEADPKKVEGKPLCHAVATNQEGR